MTWECPRCGSRLIGNGNGYIITGSNEKYTFLKCQKCGADLQIKPFGKSMFKRIVDDEPAYPKKVNKP